MDDAMLAADSAGAAVVAGVALVAVAVGAVASPPALAP